MVSFKQQYNYQQDLCDSNHSIQQAFIVNELALLADEARLYGNNAPDRTQDYKVTGTMTEVCRGNETCACTNKQNKTLSVTVGFHRILAPAAATSNNGDPTNTSTELHKSAYITRSTHLRGIVALQRNYSKLMAVAG